MKRALFVFASIFFGFALFTAVIGFAGLETIFGIFRRFSLLYLLLFLLASAVLMVINVLRWNTVLKYEGLKVPFGVLLRYRLIGAAISYITPASRVGGEPVRALLLKNKLRIRTSKAVSSILIDTSLGMSVDVIVSTAILLTLLIFFALPSELAWLAFFISVLALGVIAVFYFTLLKRLGPFSIFFRIISALTNSRLFRMLTRRLISVEKTMIEFFNLKRKGVIEAVLISLLTWPVTFIQYKFALLSIGFDASAELVFLSIIATNFTAFIPVPAAVGVQEAGHFSVFKLMASSPGTGIALSLIIRGKDLLTALIGLILLSHEGLSIMEVLRKKNNGKIKEAA